MQPSAGHWGHLWVCSNSLSSQNQSSTRIPVLYSCSCTVADTRTQILTTALVEGQQLGLISIDMPSQDPVCLRRNGDHHCVTPESQSFHLIKQPPNVPLALHNSRTLNCPNHSPRNKKVWPKKLKFLIDMLKPLLVAQFGLTLILSHKAKWSMPP